MGRRQGASSLAKGLRLDPAGAKVSKEDLEQGLEVEVLAGGLVYLLTHCIEGETEE